MYIKHYTTTNKVELVSETGDIIETWPDAMVLMQHGYVEVVISLTSDGTIFNGCVPVLKVKE